MMTGDLEQLFNYYEHFFFDSFLYTLTLDTCFTIDSLFILSSYYVTT